MTVWLGCVWLETTTTNQHAIAKPADQNLRKIKIKGKRQPSVLCASDIYLAARQISRTARTSLAGPLASYRLAPSMRPPSLVPRCLLSPNHIDRWAPDCAPIRQGSALGEQGPALHDFMTPAWIETTTNHPPRIASERRFLRPGWIVVGLISDRREPWTRDGGLGSWHVMGGSADGRVS